MGPCRFQTLFGARPWNGRISVVGEARHRLGPEISFVLPPLPADRAGRSFLAKGADSCGGTYYVYEVVLRTTGTTTRPAGADGKSPLSTGTATGRNIAERLYPDRRTTTSGSVAPQRCSGAQFAQRLTEAKLRACAGPS